MSEDLQIDVSWRESFSAANNTPFHLYTMAFLELFKLTGLYDYSFIIFDEGIRLSSKFLRATALVLDADGSWPLIEAQEEFKNTENVIIVSSKSHQSDFKIKEDGSKGKSIEKADYFHIIILLPEPITDVNIYKSVMKSLTEKYPVDPSCKDAARFFFPAKNQVHWYS